MNLLIIPKKEKANKIEKFCSHHFTIIKILNFYNKNIKFLFPDYMLLILIDTTVVLLAIFLNLYKYNMSNLNKISGNPQSTTSFTFVKG